MKRPGPILVADRFPNLRARLLELLADLSDEDWSRPTAAPLWCVKDVAAHLLGGDVGILSRRRDSFQPTGKTFDLYEDLVAFINDLNDHWTRAARRMSPRVVCDLLAFTGPQVEAYFASLDPFAIGPPVSWADPGPAPLWLDLAREFTERWHHQQQIRDATGRPALYQPYYFAPVLDAFVRALPRSFRETAAPEGTTVQIEIAGDAGGTWFIRRGASAWELFLGSDQTLATEVVIPQDAAWRLFTKGLKADAALSRAVVRGDAALAAPIFLTVSVIG